MNLLDLYAAVSLDTSDYEKGLSDASSGASSFADGFKSAIGTLGTALAAVGTAAAAAVGAASTAVAGLTKSAVSAYADYEQLVGGVETLFGKSADTVISYADNAYKTAGLSANEYMETVTSFSASLLQSLDNDTAAAAKKADKAITDMSDNANKMGTDMSSIQNAYQGFAKQNYTMLDNLKLGYGGTKEEMERLLADANELNAAQGVYTEYSIDSYADIVDAIHVVQTEMGITGTTQKEAATTIQGSIGMVSAAWENFLTGMADENSDFDTLLGNLVDSVMTAADQLIPRILQTVPRLVQGLTTLIGNLAPYIPPLIADLVPQVIEGGTELVQGLVDAFPDILEALLPGVGGDLAESIEGVFSPIFDGLSDMIENFKSGAESMDLSSIFSGLVDILTVISSAIGELLSLAGSAFEEIAPYLSDAILFCEELFSQLSEFLQPAFEGIIETLGLVWDCVQTYIFPIFEDIFGYIESAVESVDGLGITWDDVFGAIGEVVSFTFQTISDVWNNILLPVFNDISSFLVSVGSNVDDFGITWNDVFTGIQSIVSWCMTEIQNLWNTILSPVLSLISEMVMYLWPTFEEVFNAIYDLVSDVFTGIVDTWDNHLAPCLAVIVDFLEQNVEPIVTTLLGNIGDVITYVMGIVEDLWNNSLKPILDTIIDFVMNVFSGNWEDAWQNIIDIFEDLWEGIKILVADPVNVVIGVINGLIDGVCTGINAVIDALNKINIDVPDWVEDLTGMGSFGFNLSHVTAPQIPLITYAKGYSEAYALDSPTIFGASSNGLLMGGDGAGTEIVSGEDHLIELINQSVATNLGNCEEYLEEIVGTQNALLQYLQNAGFEIDGREFARLVKAVN